MASDLTPEVTETIDGIETGNSVAPNTPPAHESRVPTDQVERVNQIARTLYECERERSNHVDRLLSAAKGQPLKYHMEHWNDVADTYRADARAVLATFDQAVPSAGVVACPEGLRAAILTAREHGYDLHIGLDKIEEYTAALTPTGGE